MQIRTRELLLPSISTVINFLLLSFLVQNFTVEFDIPATVTLQMADILRTGNAQQLDREYVGGGICG
jgi:hypothetical protein